MVDVELGAYLDGHDVAASKKDFAPHVSDDLPRQAPRPLPRRDFGRDARQSGPDACDARRDGAQRAVDAVLGNGSHRRRPRAVVLGHQVWSGGALPVVVTLVGWAALLKGVTLLLVPAERIAAAYKAVGFERFYHVWMVAVLAVGLWVTAMAFVA